MRGCFKKNTVSPAPGRGDVYKRQGLSDAISCTDPGTTEEGKKVSGPRALDGSEKAQKTACLLYTSDRGGVSGVLGQFL